ncbi:hypothetical protein [Pseudomonas sp. W5-36]|uniref:hypothetical protein n=1 Tax=Pseudomonas sp. W5-36 TaxID=3097455 RepID=UPI00397923DE
MSTQSPASGVPVAASRHSGPVVFIGAGLILIALLALWYGYQVGNERTEDAYVDGNAVQVTSQITGTVTGIGADNTDYVRAGDPVVRLNPVDAEIQFERSKAALARASCERQR